MLINENTDRLPLIIMHFHAFFAALYAGKRCQCDAEWRAVTLWQLHASLYVGRGNY